MADHRTDLKKGTWKCTWKTREAVLERWLFRERNGEDERTLRTERRKNPTEKQLKIKGRIFLSRKWKVWDCTLLSKVKSWVASISWMRAKDTRLLGQRQRTVYFSVCLWVARISSFVEKKTINSQTTTNRLTENVCPMYNRKRAIHCNISLNSLNYRGKNQISILKKGQKNSLKITFKWPLK